MNVYDVIRRPIVTEKGVIEHPDAASMQAAFGA